VIKISRIVYTRHDGRVSICQPTPEFMAWLQEGGFWTKQAPGAADLWIENKIAQGRNPHGVKAYVRALGKGGHTVAEAFALTRDHDCLHLGSGFEVWSLEELFLDRWFRNAWRRSHNGGPIHVSMPAARKIQLGKLRAFSQERKLDLRWDRWRQRIRSASTPEELKAIWPMVKS
jgi:hypothetical protein